MKKLNIFKNKKAMGVAQAFMYIVLVLTFGFIMIFGVKSVLDFKCKAESVQFFQFKNQIEADVKKIYSEFGSLRKVDYTLPEGMNQICFVDLVTYSVS